MVVKREHFGLGDTGRFVRCFASPTHAAQSKHDTLKKPKAPSGDLRRPDGALAYLYSLGEWSICLLGLNRRSGLRHYPCCLS